MRDGGDHPRMPQGDSFAPTLLIAMPQLQDKNFTRSVILLCEHSGNGAIGFVVNRPTDLRAAQAVALDPPVQGDSGLMLWSGGPVEPQRGFLLLGDDPGVDNSEQIADGFHLTASVDVLRRLLEVSPDELAHRRCRLLLGYAGWSAGQLDRELAASAWLSAPPDAGLVFESAPEDMWERAIRSLGVDPMALTLGPGVQ
ncbi:MAG: YqgE/AlgH family protein [Deltaproteobacteria bacterium]|nr:MAG: YqgE/AlgH family protein [Deltaproteobacteria bacterium]